MGMDPLTSASAGSKSSVSPSLPGGMAQLHGTLSFTLVAGCSQAEAS